MSKAPTQQTAPKVFISYRWTSPEHEDWVLLFADAAAVDKIHTFFEALLEQWDKTPLNKAYSRWDNDALHYFGHECLVGFVAIAMRARAFSVAAEVLSMPLYKPRAHENTANMQLTRRSARIWRAWKAGT